MEFSDYISGIDSKLSPVKQKILKILWDSGSAFPKAWVRSSHLLTETGQKYFDRRTRELRDEVGCDIEIQHVDGEHCYRLKSPSLATINPRAYLTASQKRMLFESAKYCCQICGKHTNPGVKGLQADHKVPLIRRGSHDFANWQAICNECNVVKRRACEGCNDDCLSCSWAFPENFSASTRINFPTPLYEKLKKATGGNAVQMEKAVIEIVRKHFGES